MPKTSPELEERMSLRRAMRRGKIDPHPAGVLVNPAQLPRAGCEGHVWETLEAEESEQWQSGWKQAARCLVCDYTCPQVDASWWIPVATADFIEELLVEIPPYVKYLKSIHSYLEEAAREIRRERKGRRSNDVQHRGRQQQGHRHK
jgi:hypothetical protein